MNIVSIKYSYLTQQSQIEINGSEIGAYSNLSTVTNKPFSESVPFIVKRLDEELYDDYMIDYYALPFQCNILKSFVKNAEYCKKVIDHPINTCFSVREIFAKLSDLSKKYELQLAMPVTTKVFVEDEHIFIPSSVGIERVDPVVADVGVFRSTDNMPSNLKVSVCVADEYAYRRINGINCFMVPENGMEDFWDYYFTFEKMIPYITECMTAFKYRKIEDVDRIVLEVLRTGQSSFYFGNIPTTMDRGEAIVVPFISYPENAFRLKTSDSLIAELSDTTLVAKGDGTVLITVVDSNNNVVDSRTVLVIDHLYVQNIRLISSFAYLKKNQRNRIDAIAEPANAEDAEYLEWTSTNPSVAQIDARGNIIALQEGKTIITCCGKEAKSFIEVEVKPELVGLKINPGSISLNNGEKAVLEAEPVPHNAPIEHLRWEVDNRNIANLVVSKETKLRCQVSASTQYTGKGNLSVYDPETSIRAVAQLEVKMKQTIPGGGCGGCLIVFVVVFILLLIISSL